MEGSFPLNKNILHEYIHYGILEENGGILSLCFISFLPAPHQAAAAITGKHTRCQHEHCSASMCEETFPAVRQVEQLVSIQLRKASDSLQHAIKQNAIPWPISAVKAVKIVQKGQWVFLPGIVCI